MLSERACNRISYWVAAILTIGIIAGILVPAGPGWDFANFYDAGHKVLQGQFRDLYDEFALIGGQPPQGHLAFYGTPISALLFAPLALMAPGPAMIAFKIEGAAAILIGLWLLYSYNLPLAEKAGLDRIRYRAVFLSAALLFQPFWTIFRVGGQTTPLLFLGLVLALRWITSDRPIHAAAVMVAVVAIKPAFVLVLIPLAVFAGGRFLLCTIVAGAAAGGLSVAVMGWTVHQQFLNLLRSGMISPWVYNSSISVVFESFRAATPALGGVGTAVRLLAAVLVFVVLVRARRRLDGAPARGHFLFLVAPLAGLLLMPIVWEHYLSVLFIPVAYWLAMWTRLSTSERRLLAAICLLCCTQNLVLVLWAFQLLKGFGPVVQIAAALWKSAPLILFVALLWRHWECLVDTYRIWRRADPVMAPQRELAAAAGNKSVRIL